MLQAVHSDRAGRVFVSADYTAAAFDGASVVALGSTMPLPAGAELVPLSAEAQGLDRAGRPRLLGRGRLALGVLLPPGATRTHHPALEPSEELTPLAVAAVCADETGEIRVAATPSRGAAAPPLDEGRVDAAARDALRARPSNRLVRQLARCARDHRCADAASALFGTATAALPVAAPANERPKPDALPRRRPDARPTEDAAFHPSAEEIAEVAAAHLDGGAERVSFGRACEGEPLGAARLVEDAIRLIRERTKRGKIHLETNGSAPAVLRRLLAVGLDEVSVRTASAHADSYDIVHGPVGYRWSDVRTSLRAANEAGVRLELVLLVCPGLTDRPAELDAIVSLLDELPRASLALRDLAAEPHRLLARLGRSDRPLLGIGRALARIATDVPHAGVAIG